MKTSNLLIASAIATSLLAPAAFAANPPADARPLSISASKPVSIADKTPVNLALAALKKQEARLTRCLHGRAIKAQVKLRVNAHGWTDVIEVTPSDGRVGTCLRVIMEELHFPKGERAMFKGEIVVPIQLSSKFVLPRLQAAHATLWTLDHLR